MKVTPLDIRRKEFKRSMRGYADEEVDIFLDEVADEFERLFQENIELQERVQRFEEQMAGHAQIKEALEKTLVTAQLQADETKANARKESELILRDAELKARDIVSDSYRETQQVQQALIQLKHLEEDFRFKFRSLLEGHLKLLNDAPISVTAKEPVALEGMTVPASATPAPAPAVEGPPQVIPEPGPASAASGAAPSEPSPAVEAVGPAVAVAPEPGPEPATAAPAVVEAVPVAAEATGESSGLAPEASEPMSAFAAVDKAEAEAQTQAEQAQAEAQTQAEQAQAEARARIEQAQAERKVSQPPKQEGLEAGFFFGRRLEDSDDVFLDPDVTKNKARDFEW